MRLLRTLLIAAAFGIPAAGHARTEQSKTPDDDDAFSRIENHIDSVFTNIETEFDQLLEKLNNDYIEMLGRTWKNHDAQKEEKKSFTPKPVVPDIPKGSATPENRDISYNNVVAPERPLPDIPATLPEVGSYADTTFPKKLLFYNTPCSYRNFNTPAISLSSGDQSSVKKGWQKLTGTQGFKSLRDDCLRIREELQLCDWGYLLLTEKIASELYPASTDNQALAACALLNLSGYDCRLASGNGHFYLIFNPSHDIPGTYFPIDGKRYYIRSRGDNLSSASTCIADFHKNPTPIRMLMDRYPRFTHNPKTARRYSSAAIGSSKGLDMHDVRTVVNSSVQQFLADYPVVPWNLYGLAPVSKELQKTLFKVMKEEVAGLGPVEAVDKLLKFHYLGFNYATDDKQFGTEKPFFFDENFYYPANDCEDRAIMFARLVKDILGLDVVYLKYPNHLAAGVCFPPGVNVNGPKVTVDGKTYVFCDPTNADKAGKCPIIYTTVRPDVYKIELTKNH